MHTRFPVLFFIFAVVGASAFAQVGPEPSDEPLRWMVDSQPAPVQPDPPSESLGSVVSLDDALVTGSRRIGTPRASLPVPTPSVQVAESESAKTLGNTGFIGSGSRSSGGMMSKGSVMQTGLALGGILLLIFGLAQLYKRLAKSQGGLAGAMGAGGSAPSGLVEILGRYPVSSKMTLVVMRFDRRVLLLSHAGGGRGKNSQMGAMTTLCELDRPEDVASVLLKVRNEEGDSIAQSFARTLREADEMHDQYLDEPQYEYEQPRVRVPVRSRQPTQVLTNDAGDRAEFGVATESEAAAGVLRRRLAAMRPAHPHEQQQGGTIR